MRHLMLIGLCAAWAAADVAPAATAHPLGLNENHPYGILSDAYETPHVKWAKPYAGGEIRALVMAPAYSQRETVELAQRRSLKPTAWMSETFTQMSAPAASDPAFAFFQPPPAVVDRHLRQCVGGSYDVIVVGKLDWAMLPGDQRLLLLEKVSGGAGLVYVNPPLGNKELEIVFGGQPAPGGRAFIAPAVPLGALPAFRDKSADDLIKTSFFGQGRVVVLSYGETAPEKWGEGWPCLTPQWGGPIKAYSDEYHKPQGYVPPDNCAEMEFVPYEYYQSLVARAVVWAGGKELPARLARVVLPSAVDYPAPRQKAQVEVAAAPAGAVLNASVRSRYEYGEVYAIPPRAARSDVGMILPELPAGEYFLDLWLTTADGKVLDWSSTSFAVRADPDIAQLFLTGKSHGPGSEVRGYLALSRPLAGGETLRVELWDNYGRKLAERPVSAADETASFSLVVARPLTIMHSIRACVVREGRTVSTRRVSFPVRANRKRTDSFNEVSWSAAGNQLITHLMLRKLAQCDQVTAIDVGFSGATHARNIAAANLAALPYTTGFGHFGNHPGHIVPVLTGERAGHGCMSDPVTLKAVDEWFAMQGAIFGPYGPLAWSHGDESHYADDPDVCWSETCLAAFRDLLRERYRDLAALNREWHTNYTDWAQVKPVTYEEAKQTGNYAPWLEHRLAADRVWARLYGRTQEALRKNDPGARGGFDGPQALSLPNGGINWWVLKDHVGVLQDYLYNSESMEIFRSFAGPQHLTGMWYGTYGLTWQIGPNTVACHHFFPWYSLFHGLNSTWFWTMGNPGSLSGYAPDLTNLPFFEASRQSLREIQAGVFTMLHTARRANDGIAIHYSESSRIADALYAPDKRCTAWMESLGDFNHALEDSGLQYEYVAYEEIEKGELQQGKYRVLIMPHSRAVSEVETAAIRQFVQGGGLLIADIMPGVLNGHGSKQEPGMLADLFPNAQPGAVNAVGKGQTVLLGDKLAGYGHAASRNMQGWKKLAGRWRVLGELLDKQAQVTPQVRVAPREGGDMPPTEIVRFEVGEAQFVGLLRKYFLYDNNPYPVTVRFARKSHVYDVRSGKYLGLCDSLTTELAYQAQVYACLPYRVQSLELAIPATASRKGPLAIEVALKTSDGSPGPGHVFDVRVLTAQGRELPWYACQVAAANGVARLSIPWALNDAPGRYTVVARDVASGVTARQEVTLP